MDTKTPFSQQLAHLAKGSVDAALTDDLAELVKAVTENRKAGTITLTLKLKPIMAGHDVDQIDVVPTIAVAAPQPQQLSTRMFPTYDGDLQRSDPKQPELPNMQTVPDKPDQQPVRVDDDG